ncbi:MAG: hypothetical protein EBZ77_04730 [Chitinophagia bacterium]|nr:hypothetical protein [Chitinophagia bacterium]
MLLTPVLVDERPSELTALFLSRKDRFCLPFGRSQHKKDPGSVTWLPLDEGPVGAHFSFFLTKPFFKKKKEKHFFYIFFLAEKKYRR